MSTVELTMKSGTTVAFDADEVTLTKAGGSWTGLEWKSEEVAPRQLIGARLDDIAVIVFVHKAPKK